MKTKISELKPALAVASATKGDVLTKSKALSAQLGGPTTTTVKPASAQPTTASQPVKERPQIIEFGQHAKLVNKPNAEQKAWEKRLYMRPWFTEKPDINSVTHATSHTSKEIYAHAIVKMQELYKARSPAQPMFKAKELSTAFQIFGPAVTDVVRTAMKKLDKEGKVKTHVSHLGKQPRYSYELLELVQPAPAKAQ